MSHATKRKHAIRKRMTKSSFKAGKKWSANKYAHAMASAAVPGMPWGKIIESLTK